ncbi:hypothetical protein BpHYR1_030313 [Brachionus plicatilis]|uniref:Uncharacterized protein n=1 Tax=Brachionus plicatilis TaxID=10195 RepID=A0A3M7RRK9_BRAPC|nr:hypothetical protein BpHYR1_030313 [Brachionus plicatilis]
MNQKHTTNRILTMILDYHPQSQFVLEKTAHLMSLKIADKLDCTLEQICSNSIYTDFDLLVPKEAVENMPADSSAKVSDSLIGGDWSDSKFDKKNKKVKNAYFNTLILFIDKLVKKNYQNEIKEFNSSFYYYKKNFQLQKYRHIRSMVRELTVINCSSNARIFEKMLYIEKSKRNTDAIIFIQNCDHSHLRTNSTPDKTKHITLKMMFQSQLMNQKLADKSRQKKDHLNSCANKASRIQASRIQLKCQLNQFEAEYSTFLNKVNSVSKHCLSSVYERFKQHKLDYAQLPKSNYCLIKNRKY